MFCPKCGDAIPEKARFCMSCGSNLNELKNKLLTRNIAVKNMDLKPTENAEVVATCSNVDESLKMDIPKGEANISGQTINIIMADEHANNSTSSKSECPVCGRRVKEMESFHCLKCDRIDICLRHQDDDTYFCNECMKTISRQQQKAEANQKAITKKRLAKKKNEKQAREAETKMLDSERKSVWHGIEMVFVNGGSFEMGNTFGDGDDNEKPIHAVTLNSYYIGTTQVTFSQYDQYCESTGANKPSDSGWGRGNRPVINVNYKDAVQFCNWLSEETEKGFCLPTEAEWEYAARAGGKIERYSGTSKEAILGNYAWYNDISSGRTCLVGMKRPNGLGIYDMSGNVWEWCQDWFDEEYYNSSPQNNPQGPSNGSRRVLRGGSWLNDAKRSRCSHRFGSDPGSRFRRIGFRICTTI
jgi:formylglycine-generating enzyme required for sulfatase activity